MERDRHIRRVATFSPGRHPPPSELHVVKCLDCGREFETYCRTAIRCGSSALGTGCAYARMLSRGKRHREKKKHVGN